MSSDAIVFIVDDDEAVRQSTAWLIESIGLKVITFVSADEFLDKYNNEQGCIVMDVRMPGMSGLEAQEEMKNKGIALPLIFITGHGDVPMAVRALKRGAFDFIEKPFNDQLLLDSVQRGLKTNNEAIESLIRNESVDKRISALTPREKEVMIRVTEGKPNKVIAHELSVSIKTVEVHRARMMEKMEANSVAELVKTTLLSGLF
ncbi:MAG: response regulator transcription factor [gamma proteobacterium symbiont of Bathyaustriella thionipta]|nr:response regulator transcription factor [gamma proteobacterium symbiont of Bathyaustriella thionipta]MCU7951219.1 response regulator transcription factor [gamma proteobacterium symbiont of Bathyaustriella thionipta]MCU7953131.1 response regulator transcription factor [gamma proteobacterium symbiont of Bathyaustriella thionipta]MCU7957738.1 response regulator transcription factor [gamma proteobacterium symbiont of Bathyaustriella thionipta]MCU7968214.1 response regulator transcription factor 